MSRQVGSLYRSISHPANLQNPLPIIILFAFPPPESPHVNTSSGMDSDTYSEITVFNTISQFNNTDIETPDKFANSEPSPPAFSQPPFRIILSQSTNDSPSSISHISQATPTYSPFTNDHSNNDSPETTQISQELDNLITLQQQIQHPHTLTIHQLSSNITSSNPPTPTPSSDCTPSLDQYSTSTLSSSTTNRAYRTFKRKFPNHPFPSKLGTARDYVNYPEHINTPAFLQTSLPLLPQYIISHSNPHTEQPNYVDEHVLIPTLYWTSFYCFSNPLCIPLNHTLHEIERSKLELFRLTTALTPRQSTHIGYKKLLKTFTAPQANDFSIEYYNQNILRLNQDQFLDNDKFASPQLTENFFIETPYIFTVRSLDRKHDHIISEALTYIQAYKSFHDKFQIVSLTFHFLTPKKKRDLVFSHDIMLRTKQTHTYTYYRFIQNRFNLHTPARQPHHRFQFIISKYTLKIFLKFHILY